MKTRTEFTYTRAIVYGVITELFLVLIQYISLLFYTGKNPDAIFAFTSDYMVIQGFYVFQIIGFIIYSSLVFFIIRKIQVTPSNKILVLILAGAVVELSFYLIVQAEYQMAFFYSILDKFVAGVIGIIVYYSTSD